MTAINLVEKHLLGNTTPEEDSRLESDIPEWRETLLQIMNSCDRGMIAARETSIRKGTAAARIEFQKVKQQLVARKHAAGEVRRELKAQMNEKSPHEEAEHEAFKTKVLSALDRIERRLDSLERMEGN